MSSRNESDQGPQGLPTGEVIDLIHDDIRVLDHPLPVWWVALFRITILLSTGYAFFYMTRPEWTDVTVEYENAQQALNERLFAEIGALQPDHATLTRFMSNPSDRKWLELGASIFRTNCVSCHGKDGQGFSGPNLTDDSYKNVTTLVDIPRVVTEGAANGQMPAWGGRLSANEIILVSAFVASLRGQSLPGRSIPGEQAILPWSR